MRAIADVAVGIIVAVSLIEGRTRFTVRRFTLTNNNVTCCRHRVQHRLSEVLPPVSFLSGALPKVWEATPMPGRCQLLRLLANGGSGRNHPRRHSPGTRLWMPMLTRPELPGLRPGRGIIAHRRLSGPSAISPSQHAWQRRNHARPSGRSERFLPRACPVGTSPPGNRAGGVRK